MARDPEVLAHLEWLGYVQPVGVVVSVLALLTAQVHVGRLSPADHQALLDVLARSKDGELLPEIPDLRRLTETVLVWEPADLQEPGSDVEIALPEYHDLLRPSFVVPDPDAKAGPRRRLMLVQCLTRATE